MRLAFLERGRLFSGQLGGTPGEATGLSPAVGSLGDGGQKCLLLFWAWHWAVGTRCSWVVGRKTVPNSQILQFGAAAGRTGTLVWDREAQPEGGTATYLLCDFECPSPKVHFPFLRNADVVSVPSFSLSFKRF